MDEELLALWNRLNGNGEGDAAAEPLTDAELAELRAGIDARRQGIDAANPSEEDLAVLREVRDALAAVDEVIHAREADAATRRAEAATILAEIDPAAQAASGDGGGEGVEGDGGAGGGEGTPAEGAPQEGGEPAPVEVTPAEGQPTEAHQPDGQGQQAAAPPRVPSITHLAHRMPSANRRPAPAPSGRARLIASADIPGVQAGDVVDLEQWAQGAARRIESVMKVRTPGADGEPIYLGSVHYGDQYPEERFLHQSDQAGNDDKIDAVTRPEAIAAAGGICGPVAVDYSVTTIATADRPVRDGMTQFGADRGGVQFTLPHTLAAVTTDAPAAIWTHTTDASPGQSTKPHATFSCQPVVTELVDAVTSIAQFDNFTARYFREQIEQYLATVDTVHARLAEATLLAKMVSGSTAVVAGNNGTGQTGAASEFLAELDRIVARFRYVHRTPAEYPMHVWYPEWFEDMMRADLARELPGNSGGQSERLAVADAEIDRFLSVRNINASTFLDSPTGFGTLQGWTGLQPIGDASPWPAKVLVIVTHEGAWQFLDGGELNLGMVRDSTLNQTNSFQMFSETFEQAAFRGHESLAVTMDLCPDGARAAAVDTSTLCATGS